MFDEAFLQNMAFMGNYDTLRLQHELREKEAEIERLKAKLKDQGAESYYVHAINDVMDFLERAKTVVRSKELRVLLFVMVTIISW